MTLKIEGTSERVSRFVVWKLWDGGNLLCAFYGPMAAASATTVAVAMEADKLASPVDAIKWRAPPKITTANTTLRTDSERLRSADASDLGLMFEQFPEFFETDLGNGQRFLKFHDFVDDGELIYVEYLQAQGQLTLRVYNN